MAVSDKLYGNFELISAQLLLIPTAGDTKMRMAHREVAPLRAQNGGPKIRSGIFSQRYHPYGRRKPIPRVVIPPVPVVPPVSSIGCMDIGAGNCNLLMNQANEPVAYFDTGYPLWFYLGSLPNTMRFGNPAYQGPIMQNQAGTLQCVLSHWDWDHWRLAHVAGMQNLPWIVPNQFFGPSALVFYNAVNLLGNLTVFAGAPAIAYPYFTLFQCAVAPGAPGAVILNNTGLAMSVSTNLPVADANPHYVVMTGDANFNSVQGIFYINMTGIEAVHHGSNAHGAAANLPNPTVGYAGNGKIFYSYGLRITGGGAFSYVYGFPVPAAVLAYQGAGWTVERSTAEGAFLRGLPTTLANRGNIRIGNQTPLNAFYNYSAFFGFPNFIN